MTESQNIALTNYFLILILWTTATTYGVLFKFFPSLFSDNSPWFYHLISIVLSLFFTGFLITVLEKLPIKKPEEQDKVKEIPIEIFMAVSFKNRMGLGFLVISTLMAIFCTGILLPFIAALLMAAAISILMNAYYQEKSELKSVSSLLGYVLVVLIFSSLGLIYIATEAHLATLGNGDVKATIIKLILGGSFGFCSTVVNHHLATFSDKYVEKKLNAKKISLES
jgi:hypothetical protein